MTKRSNRPAARRRPAKPDKWHNFPVLFTLVAGIIVFGVFHYSGMLALFSAIFAGFFGWLWWRRATQAAHDTARPRPPRRRAKHAR
jgi:nicotinamide riboside transporter PnuC